MSINFAIHNFYITRVIPTVDDNLVDAGTDHFGAAASVIILPGGQVVPNAVIQAGTIVGKKIS
jgi:hypothetical protein